MTFKEVAQYLTNPGQQAQYQEAMQESAGNDSSLGRDTPSLLPGLSHGTGWAQGMLLLTLEVKETFPVALGNGASPMGCVFGGPVAPSIPTFFYHVRPMVHLAPCSLQPW